MINKNCERRSKPCDALGKNPCVADHCESCKYRDDLVCYCEGCPVMLKAQDKHTDSEANKGPSVDLI